VPFAGWVNMNQAELTHLVAGMRFRLNPGRKLRDTWGARPALERLRPCVAALIAEERLEFGQHKGFIVRRYVERLIAEAVQHGDKHKDTMEVASWWLQDDKSAVHKLFKVLVPRFKDYTTSYTRVMATPLYREDNHRRKPNRLLVELRGNPFPPLEYPNSKPNRNHIHNVLLSEAKREWRLQGEKGQ